LENFQFFHCYCSSVGYAPLHPQFCTSPSHRRRCVLVPPFGFFVLMFFIFRFLNCHYSAVRYATSLSSMYSPLWSHFSKI
jgi:hypothetical protein